MKAMFQLLVPPQRSLRKLALRNAASRKANLPLKAQPAKPMTPFAVRQMGHRILRSQAVDLAIVHYHWLQLQYDHQGLYFRPFLCVQHFPLSPLRASNFFNDRSDDLVLPVILLLRVPFVICAVPLEAVIHGVQGIGD